MARAGHERFTQPTVAAHRRYEALRAYYVEELPAAEIAARFGYTKASVQTLISAVPPGGRGRAVPDLAAGAQAPAQEGRRPRAGDRAAPSAARDRGDRRRAGSGRGRRLSRTAVWEILREEGLSRMPKPASAQARRASARAAGGGEGTRAARDATGRPTVRSRLSTPACSCWCRNWSRSIYPDWSRRPDGRRPASFRRSARCSRCWRSSSQAAGGEATCARSCTTRRSARSPGLNVLPKTWHLTTY